MSATEIYEQADLALAAYAVLKPGLTADQQNIDALVGTTNSGMAERQAQEFALLYPEIIAQTDDSFSGFSLTAFRSADGAIALAIRGSDDLMDWSATNSDIAISGAGYLQIVGLYNAWQRLTHKQGELIEVAAWNETDGVVVSGTAVNDLGTSDAPLISPGAAVDVVGHSLGGHLALAFAGLFPLNARQISVFNAPGYIDSPTNRNFFASLGGQLPQGTSPSGVPTFNVIADAQPGPGESLSPIAGLHSRPGVAVDIAIENQAPPTDEPNFDLALNHSHTVLTDSLAVFALLNKFSPTLSTTSFESLLASAARGTAASLEHLMDALSETLGIGTDPLPVGNAQRNALYEAIYDAQANDRYKELGDGAYLWVLADSDAPTIAEDSLLEFGTFLALTELLPFAIAGPMEPIIAAHEDLYLRWSNDRTKRGTEAEDVEFSDLFIEDRAAFLATKNAANSVDLDSIVNPTQLDNWRYVDLPQNFTVTAFNLTPTENPRLAVFGGDAPDRLQGGSQSDHFYGGAGTDWLIGRGGDDYEEGGYGLDLYQYNARISFAGTPSNDGNDIVRDIDGVGVLRYTFTEGGIFSDSIRSAVIADTSFRIDAITWQSADGKFEYQKLGSDLVIRINGDADGSITLRGFRDGDFGIHLWSGRVDPTIGRNLEGDRKPEDSDPDTAGEQVAYDSWGNVVTGIEQVFEREDALFGRDDDVGDAIAGGGGNDIIFGDTPMMSASGPRTGFDPLASGGTDWLDGGSGRDFIDAGPGDDLVEGGFGGSANGEFGGDVVQGGLGDDTLYGNFRGELGAAIRSGETDASSPLKGDFLSGGAGEDWLVGADTSDVLVGGGGRDVLVGGAGDDTIRGDDGQGATTLLWTVTRSVGTVDGQDVYELGFTGTNFFDFSAGAADAIYAGAGEDWVFAEVGDDFVDGGSGNDVLFGGAGADIVLGSTGNDVIVGDDGIPSAVDGGDYLDGGDGDDTIYGNGGDDIIVGGRGNDRLVGGAGKDVYVYDKGDGRDVINDSDEAGSAASVIQFGPELLADEVRFGVGSLKVYFPDGGEIHIEGFDQLDPSRTPVVGELRFEDGQVMTYADILTQGFDIDGTSNPELLTGTGVVDRMRGLEGNDVLIGFDGDDFLYGGDGSDTLHGGAGDDYLDGGEGFDNLYGGAGDDTYAYDTFDTITDSEGANRIVFNPGITPESLSLSSFTVGGQPRLLIERPGTAGPGLDIRGASLSSSSFVYAFADGRTLSQTELLQAAYFAPQSIAGTAEDDSLSGFAGNDDVAGGAGDDVLSGGGGDDSLRGGGGDDALSGGTGADWLDGGEGADVYLFGYGEGNDTVVESGSDASVDTVHLAEGVSLSNVTLAHQPNGDLTLTLDTTQERLTLQGWYAGARRVEQVVFADGTVIAEAELGALSLAPISGTAGDDVLSGTPYPDTLEGLAGDDVLDGGPNIWLPGDAQSNDLLIGGSGHDTYVLGWRGARDTVIEEPGEASTVRLAPGMTFDDVVGSREGDDLFVHGRGTEHGLLLKNFYIQPGNWSIETALGSSLSLADFLARPATAADAVLDLWEAQKTRFKHDWYPAPPYVLQPDGTAYLPPLSAVSMNFSWTYDNGDWTNGTGGLAGVSLVERTVSFGNDTITSSDAASQLAGAPNWNETTTISSATYEIGWDRADISRTTQYLGTYVGFDALLHSLYRTTASVSLPGTVQSIALGAASGASGQDIVNAVMGGGSLPDVVNGELYSATASFRPAVHFGGPSNNVIGLQSFGMADAGAGNDIIDGSLTADPGPEVGDFLYGGVGNDGITGSGMDDLIAGGPGDDRLAGWAGNDTYFFSADNGVDIVNEATWYLWDTYDATALYNADSGARSEDTVEFGEGISLNDLALSWGTYDSPYSWSSPTAFKTYDTLDVYWAPGSGLRVMMPDRFDADVRLTMAYWAGSSWGIEHFKFADGSTLSLQQMADRIPAQTLNGTAGDDVLQGSAGNNAFFAGAGSDSLYGSYASDVYYFNLGDGEDTVFDPGGSDKVVFGEGITPDMVSLGTGSLLVRVGDEGDALHIEYFNPDDPLGSGAIETYEFADGTALTHAQLLARGFDLYGTDSAETLVGTSLTDRLYGFAGDDTYVVDNPGDRVVENAGEGIDLVQSSVSYLLGDNVENLLLTGFSSIDGIGNALDNVIIGNSASNTIDGGAGADTMNGGGGDDTYIIDDPGDLVSDTSGIDLALASITYALPASIEKLTLTGSADIDGFADPFVASVITGNSGSNRLEGALFRGSSLFGMDGNDTLIGGNQADVLDGGTGADTMQGGAGNDTYVVDDPGDAVIDSSGTDTVQASISYALPDDLENLTLVGAAAINATGNALDNVLAGNSGANVLYGLAGNDTYVIDDAADLVAENADEGIDLVQSSVSHMLGANVENLTLLGASDIDGWGNVQNNVIIGNAGANSLFGLDGDDLLDGGAEADVLVGGHGDDTYIVDNSLDVVFEVADGGIDLVRASVTHALSTNVENLMLIGSSAINGTGNSLNNGITGNSAANIMDGGPGADTMAGNAGNDVYIVDDAGDVVIEAPGQGIDTVQSSVTYALPANVERLVLTGSANVDAMGNSLNNVITGNTGDNVLEGGAGSDIMVGGAGDDILIGGEGSDTYRFGLGSGQETVVESDAQGDDVDVLLLGAGITPVNLHGARSGQDLALSIDGAADHIRVTDWFATAGNRIERIQFASGTVWDGAMLEALAGTSNNPPVLSVPIADQFANEDSQFTFTLPEDTFTDPDSGDALVYSVRGADGSPLPPWLAFDAATRTLSGLPQQSDVGSLELRAAATDSQGLSIGDVFVLNVANVNDAPVLAHSVDDQNATEDAPFSFAIAADTFTDEDPGDLLSWYAARADGEALPAWLNFDALNRVFTGTPTNGDVGAFDVRVTATDASEASASDIFDIVVANTNDAPTLVRAIANRSATEDQRFELGIPSDTFADIDISDSLTLSASLSDGGALPAWLTFDGAALSGTPLNEDVGAYDLKVQATDIAGESVASVFRLEVANVNDAPMVVTPIADRSFEANSTFIFSVPAGTFFDQDRDDVLSYSAGLFDGGSLPRWLTFDPAMASFRGDPSSEDIGISHVAVTATDSSGASATSDFGLIVHAASGASVSGGDGDNLLYGGSGDETLAGRAGDDMLFGDVGDDVLRGGSGNDVLQGGAGDDVLRGGTGNNVLDGGSGDDLIFDGSGNSFISGGAGNDTIKMSAGNDIVAFNSGDGWDTIIGGGDGGNTLSLGGGIRYSDLALSKDGDDLIVRTGQNEGVVLNDWYAGAKSILNLQIVLDATDEFDAASAGPLYNRRVQTFDFLGLVSTFDQARTSSPGLTSWDVTNALLQWHLWAADDFALGGDLAYWYGRNRTLAGISLAAAQQVIGAPGFGSDAQSLQSFSGLQEGFVKLS